MSEASAGVRDVLRTEFEFTLPCGFVDDLGDLHRTGVMRLGNIEPVTPAVVERLFAADFAYLQDLYMRINEPGGALAETQCPECGLRFAVDLG